jgi:hypothetical protein
MWIAEFDESIYVTRLVALKTHFVSLAAIGTDSPKYIPPLRAIGDIARNAFRANPAFV